MFLQNLATFKNELLSVNTIQAVLDAVDVNQFKTLEAMIENIRSQFLTLIRSHRLVPALGIYVNRKLDKVARHVTQ